MPDKAIISEEISPDGIVTKTSAAPIRVDKPSTDPKAPKSIEDLKKVDDGQQHQPEPTDEENEKVNFEQFLDAAGKDKPVVKEEPVKKQTVPKDDEIVPLEKVDIKDKEPDKDKLLDPTKGKASTDTDSRDFTGIDEADVPLFKKMANEAFDKLKPIYTAHKQLKQDYDKVQNDFKTLKEKGPQLPESYHEHPAGYLLNPEFQQNVAVMNEMNQIMAHWQKQYDDVASGATEFDFLDYDKNGNLTITGKIPANKGTEAKLSSYINHAQNQVTKATSDVQTSAKLHASKYGEAVRSVVEARTKYFGGLYNTPENKAVYEPLVKQHFDALPATFKQSPLAMAYAESLVMNQALAMLLNKAAAEKKDGSDKIIIKSPEELEAEKIRKGSPTTKDINGDGGKKSSNGNDENLTIDDFEAVKRGY